MKSFMKVFQAFFSHMSIDLRGGEIAVSEEHLHNTEIRTVIHQMCRKGMTENVWWKGIRIDSR